MSLQVLAAATRGRGPTLRSTVCEILRKRARLPMLAATPTGIGSSHGSETSGRGMPILLTLKHDADVLPRHQILLKATALGLKESSTRPTQIRGTKRRREEEASPPPRPTPSPPSITHTNSTPTESQGPTTPASSPTMQKPSQPPAQRPPSSKAGMPWPMPTVAAPVTIQDKSIFYRPSSSASRTHEASKPISGPAHATHPYMYNPHK